MNEAAQFLIDGYLDNVLTIEQHEELSAWIRSSPENISAFAAAVMLHDRLRNEMMISSGRQGVSPPCRSAGDEATGLSEAENTRRADA